MTLDVLPALRSHLAAIDGQVCEDFVLLRWDLTIPVDYPGDGLTIGCEAFQEAEWPIIHFASELEVRRYLWQQQERQIIFLVQPDWVERIPIDIRDRSFQRRVRPITVRDVLAALTGVSWCAASESLRLRPLCEQYLADLVSRCGSWTRQAAEDEQIPQATMQEWLVEAALGFRIAGLTHAQVLARAYRNRKKSEPMQSTLGLLLGEMVQARYPAHAVLLSWALAEPARTETLLVDGARIEAESAITSVPALGRLSQLRTAFIANQQDKEAAALRFVEQVRELSLSAIRELGEAGCGLVETHVIEIGGALNPSDYNPVLPTAFEEKIGELATRTKPGNLPNPTEVAALSNHLFAGRHKTELAALEAMGHLSAFLPAVSDSSSAVELATWYAHDGAHADLQAKRLEVAVHGVIAPLVKDSAEKLLADYWEARDAVNDAFAHAYASNYDGTLFDQRIAGLQSLLDRRVRPRVEMGERLLIICLDGCSYCDFIGLVEELATVGYGLGETLSMPGLSLLPSTTEVSRLALFAGQVPDDPIKFGLGDATQARDRQIAAFAQAIKPHTGRLLLKSDLNAGFTRLHEAIADTSLTVVAVVINSIDDAIGTANVMPHVFTLLDVAHLKDAIVEGCAAGRDGGSRPYLPPDHRTAPEGCRVHL